MKIKISKKKKSKRETPNKKSLGEPEQLANKKHLEEKREEFKSSGALENYCDMLETQLRAMTDKMLQLSGDKEKLMILVHPESDSWFLGTKHDARNGVEIAMSLDELVTRHIIETSPETASEVQKELSKTKKVLNTVRKHLNAAANELGQAQIYLRDNYDKE